MGDTMREAWLKLAATRGAALARGDKTYFTGGPCNG